MYPTHLFSPMPRQISHPTRERHIAQFERLESLARGGWSSPRVCLYCTKTYRVRLCHLTDGTVFLVVEIGEGDRRRRATMTMEAQWDVDEVLEWVQYTGKRLHCWHQRAVIKGAI